MYIALLLNVARGLPSRKPHEHVRTLRTFVYALACAGTLETNACLDITRRKRYVRRDVSAYLLLGNSRGIDPRARAVSHTYARVDYPIYICAYLCVYHADTYVTRTRAVL